MSGLRAVAVYDAGGKTALTARREAGAACPNRSNSSNEISFSLRARNKWSTRKAFHSKFASRAGISISLMAGDLHPKGGGSKNRDHPHRQSRRDPGFAKVLNFRDRFVQVEDGDLIAAYSLR
jgi:hypothetical protein